MPLAGAMAAHAHAHAPPAGNAGGGMGGWQGLDGPSSLGQVSAGNTLPPGGPEEHLTAWLASVGLAECEPALLAQKVDWEVLSDLTDVDIESLGLPVGLRRRLRNVTASLWRHRHPGHPEAHLVPPWTKKGSAAGGEAGARGGGEGGGGRSLERCGTSGSEFDAALEVGVAHAGHMGAGAKGAEEQGEKNEADEDYACLICCETDREACLVPCGHMVACLRCSQCLLARDDPCPICRVKIANVIKPIYI
eukprot:jgi/Mesen1/620/ME000108S10777